MTWVKLDLWITLGIERPAAAGCIRPGISPKRCGPALEQIPVGRWLAASIDQRSLYTSSHERDRAVGHAQGLARHFIDRARPLPVPPSSIARNSPYSGGFLISYRWPGCPPWSPGAWSNGAATGGCRMSPEIRVLSDNIFTVLHRMLGRPGR